MAFRADAEWARAYMEKKGKALPPDLPADPPVAGSCKVPDMEEGDPCRRCGSGWPGYRVPLRDGDRVWVCEDCEDKTVARLNRRGRDLYDRDL